MLALKQRHAGKFVAAVFFFGTLISPTPTPAGTRLPTSLPADEIGVRQGLVYSKPGGAELMLDLARPKQRTKPLPAVVCIHGGGWRSGDRASMFGPYAKFLAGYGYVAVSPTYRLSPKNQFPAAIADVRNCVRWLRRHAGEYGIDPDHIGAMGMSAGGHLTNMLAVASDDDHFGPDDEPEAKESARVQAAVNYFGPSDLTASDWSPESREKYMIPFFGGTLEEKAGLYRQGSPITYVSKDDPPLLTFHGRIDNLVPVSQAELLHRRLQELGVKDELVVLPKQGHGWGEPHLTRTRKQMVMFFDLHLKGKAVQN